MTALFVSVGLAGIGGLVAAVSAAGERTQRAASKRRTVLTLVPPLADDPAAPPGSRSGDGTVLVFTPRPGCPYSTSGDDLEAA